MELLNIVNIVSALLALAYVYTIIQFSRGWRKIAYFKLRNEVFSTKVSVIIAARNESSNIENTLNAILNQDFPSHLLEVIVVNDHSEDNTAELVKNYAPKVKLINFIDNRTINSYKKAAIAVAISEASGKLIITTDADCIMEKKWLQNMVGMYEQSSFKMISGPVAYYNEKSFFERLQSLEFLFLIGMGASTIGNKRPTTCNGANLLYEKEVFLEVGGFAGIDNKASGDDELLLHKVVAKYPDAIGFAKSYESIVRTYAKPNLTEFIAQRKRWASKSTSYKDKYIILLGIGIWLFNLSIFTLLISGFNNIGYLNMGLILLIIKIALEFYFIVKVAQFANRKRLMVLSPILSLVHIIYLIYIGIAGNLGSYKWKGRTVK